MDRTGIAVGLAALVLAVWVYQPLSRASVVYEDDQWLQGSAAWTIPGRGLSQWTATIVGLDAGRQHLVNVGLHLLTGGALGLVAGTLASPLAGVFAAAIWWLHPLNVEAAAYISARGDLLVALCALLSVWCALAWSRHGAVWRLGMLVPLLAGAVLSKEIGVMAIPLTVMTLLVLGRRQPYTWLRMALMGASGVVLGLAWHRILSWVALNPDEGGSVFAWPQFAVLQLTALWHLLALIVWPVGLSIDHDTIGLAAPWTTAALVGSAAAVVAALVCWRRRPIMTWAVLWLALSVAPRFLVPTNEFLKEYTLYPAWLGLAVLLGQATAWCWTARPRAALEPLGVRA